MTPRVFTHHGLFCKTTCTTFCIWIIVCFSSANTSSLMSQIREKQEVSPLSKGIQLSPESWMAVPRVLQDALTSIDDKLKSLDTFSYTLKLAKLDFSLEQLVRRLDNIETKLGRLDTKFDLRMEKVEEVVLGKDLKEEFSNEHLVRKMENLNEKFNSKTTFIEAKIDIKMDRVSQKLESLEKDIHTSVEEILERMVKNNERQVIFENQVLEKLQNIEDKQKKQDDVKMKEDILSSLEERIGSVETKVEEQSNIIDQVRNQDNSGNILQKAENIKQAIENSMHDIKLYINGSACFNGLTENRFRALLKSHEYEGNFESDEKLEKINVAVYKTLNLSELKFRKLDSDMELYSKKVISSMQELWKSQDHHRGLLNNFIQQGNETKAFINETVLELKQQLMPLILLEPRLADLSSQLPTKLTDLNTAIDSSFATLLVAQNTFISTCRRIQMEESHVYDILKEVVYEMRNRSILDIQRISEEIQNMHFNLGGKLSHMLDAIFNVGNATTNRAENFLNQNRSLLSFPDLANSFIKIQNVLSKLSTRLRKHNRTRNAINTESSNNVTSDITTIDDIDDLKSDMGVKSEDMKGFDNTNDNSYYEY